MIRILEWATERGRCDGCSNTPDDATEIRFSGTSVVLCSDCLVSLGDKVTMRVNVAHSLDELAKRGGDNG